MHAGNYNSIEFIKKPQSLIEAKFTKIIRFIKAITVSVYTIIINKKKLKQNNFIQKCFETEKILTKLYISQG